MTIHRFIHMMSLACAVPLADMGVMQEVPESMRCLLEAEEQGDQAEQLSQTEGCLTASVQGSHIHITVRLRRWWALKMAWRPTDRQMRNGFRMLIRTARYLENAIRFVIVLGIFYFFYEIGNAFLPGGGVERVLGGVK